MLFAELEALAQGAKRWQGKLAQLPLKEGKSCALKLLLDHVNLQLESHTGGMILLSSTLWTLTVYLRCCWHKQILWQKSHSCYLVDSTQANKHILCSELSFFPLLPKEQQRGWGRNLGSGGNTQRWPGLCLLQSSVCSTLCILTQRMKPSAHQIYIRWVIMLGAFAINGLLQIDAH